MEHYSIKNHVKSSHKEIITEFLLAFLSQYLMLFISIELHRAFKDKGAVIQPVVQGIEGASSPTLGRLIYMISAIVLGIVLAVIASKTARSSLKRNVEISYCLGTFAGLFFWQGIGEDSWHFGINIDGVFTNFNTIEETNGFFCLLIVMLILIYAAVHNSFDWGIWVAITSFMSNWLGHFSTLGTYPFVSSFIEKKTWFLTVGIFNAVVLLAAGAFMGLYAAKDKKGRMFASMVSYLGIACLVLTIAEG